MKEEKPKKKRKATKTTKVTKVTKAKKVEKVEKISKKPEVENKPTEELKRPTEKEHRAWLTKLYKELGIL